MLVMCINTKLGNGGTLNVYSQIGLVMLVGPDHQARDPDRRVRQPAAAQGMEKFDAVVEAATLRLRPILMTTAAMVLGAVPLALSHGAGAEARQAIGWVVVGGMLLGTLLTLFVIPRSTRSSCAVLTGR